jgi:PadR family transcriptional regulator, regulatory protein PadR
MHRRGVLALVLLEEYRAQSLDAVIEVAAHHRTATPESFALHDAQFVLARSYGFETWPKLKAAVDRVTTARLHNAVQKGDVGAVGALLARRPEIVDLMRGGPSGFEIRALHTAVMRRDVEMTRRVLEAGADTRGGVWPNRDATSPRTIAEERGYEEIVAMMVEQEKTRGARGANAVGDGLHRLRHAMMTGGEEAVIAVFESQPSLAGVLDSSRLRIVLFISVTDRKTMSKPTDLVQGTLDLLILRVLGHEPMHGWAIAQRIRQMSKDELRVGQSALYPALHKLEQHGWIEAEWALSENNRRAKYYTLTAAGRKALKAETAQWERLSTAISLVVNPA